MLSFSIPGFGGLIVSWECCVQHIIRRDSISFYSIHSLCNISLNNCFQWLSVEFIPTDLFLAFKNQHHLHVQPSILRGGWEGHQFSYGMWHRMKREMGHGGVQISLSLRDELRLPDQFWQVTGSFQGRHICDKGQAGFHVSARTLQSQVGLTLLTIRVCEDTWFLFEIKLQKIPCIHPSTDVMQSSYWLSPLLCSRSCGFECQYVPHLARRAMHVNLDPEWLEVTGIMCYVCM